MRSSTPFNEFAPSMIWLVEQTSQFLSQYLAFEKPEEARRHVELVRKRKGMDARIVGRYVWHVADETPEMQEKN